MKVRVTLFASFEEKMPAEVDEEGAAAMEFPAHSTIGTVLDHFQIPHEDAFIILLNGKHAQPDTPLVENAELSLFPAIVGG